MAEALEALHVAGFIHRDICPRNFVASKDLTRVKLIDFGLTVPNTPEFRAPGNRTGTPNYMSPEVVRRYPTDKRLDIFSLGVTFYELLTFQLPWQSGTDGRAALQHSTKPPIPIEELRPDIDPHLAKAVMRCMEPDVRERTPDVGHFLQGLRLVESETA